MTPNISLTPREAAFVLDESLKSITRVLDGQPTRRRLVERRGIAVRVLTEFDLLFFLAIRDTAADLTPSGRHHLFEALHGVESSKVRKVPFGSLSIDMSRYKVELRVRMQRFERLRRSVDHPHDGSDPLIKGKKIEVHRVAALLDGGATVEEVMHDFPSLSAAQIETAREYARAHPKHGRPYPKQSLKSFFRSGALRHMREALEAAETDE